MNRSLVIAGNGYLGRQVSVNATTAGWHTVPLSRSPDPGSLACDITDRTALARLRESLDCTPDAIVHCASSGRGGPDAYRSVFLDGTHCLLEAFPEALLLFVSSTSVYGQTDGSVVTEHSPAAPDRETSRILLEAEELVRAHRGIVIRLAGLYGPGRSVILKRFLDGSATIEEDGRRFLNQIHRDDAADAILHLLSQNPPARGEVFNAGDSHPLHQAACYQALVTLFGLPLPPSTPRNLHRKRAWTHKRVSNAKLLATGWQPAHPSFLDAARDIAPTLPGSDKPTSGSA